MIKYTEYIEFFRAFELSTSWYEVKMVDFTKKKLNFVDLSTSSLDVLIVYCDEYI